MNQIKNICVFCGASTGNEDLFVTKTKELGRQLSEQEIGLVYGGGRIGIMGIIADEVISNSGKVCGVIPHFLHTKEVAHAGLTELITVDSMHERKTIMYEKSDAIIMLPGGYGTLEEFFEVLTWAQLGLHQKPIGILNINNYYGDLIQFFYNMKEKGFIKQMHLDLFCVAEEPDELLNKLKNYKAPEVQQWINIKTS